MKASQNLIRTKEEREEKDSVNEMDDTGQIMEPMEYITNSVGRHQKLADSLFFQHSYEDLRQTAIENMKILSQRPRQPASKLYEKFTDKLEEHYNNGELNGESYEFRGKKQKVIKSVINI